MTEIHCVIEVPEDFLSEPKDIQEAHYTEALKRLCLEKAHNIIPGSVRYLRCVVHGETTRIGFRNVTVFGTVSIRE
jgi:hypothetical protein